MQTKELIDTLIADYDCTLHSEVGPAPSDVDVYAPPVNFEKAKQFITSQGYVLMTTSPYQVMYQRFENNGQRYIIDLITDYNMWLAYTGLASQMALSPTGNERLGRSTMLHKSFKYLCYTRTDKTTYIEPHLTELRAFLKDENNFTHLSPRLRGAVDGTLDELFRIFKNRFLLTRSPPHFFLGGWLRYRWRKLGTGCSIAFVGPDGSGKGFIIDKLQPAGSTRIVYMGDWFFILQPLYNIFLHKFPPPPYNRFVYGLYIIENYIRQLRVFFWRSLGYIVLIDRFPGTNRNITFDGALGWINRFTFRIFPKPDLLAMLYAPPEVIYQRKQELPQDKIRKSQDALRTLLAGTRHMVLDTEQLDVALNTLLAVMYANMYAKLKEH